MKLLIFQMSMGWLHHLSPIKFRDDLHDCKLKDHRATWLINYSFFFKIRFDKLTLKFEIISYFNLCGIARGGKCILMFSFPREREWWGGLVLDLAGTRGTYIWYNIILEKFRLVPPQNSLRSLENHFLKIKFFCPINE